MEEKKNEIILFENQRSEVRGKSKEETVWLTQAQMAELFDVKQSTLSEHINNIFKEGELEEKLLSEFPIKVLEVENQNYTI